MVHLTLGISFLIHGWYFFLKACIGHFNNTDSLSYEDPPSGKTFHYTILKKNSHWLRLLPISSHQKNLLSIAHDDGYRFSKILIFGLKYLTLSMVTSTFNCFSWSDRLTVFIFENLSDKYSSLKTHSLSLGHYFN